MDEQYVYEEEQAEEGLTLKKIGHFFKKGWLIMLIAVIAAVAISAAIALPLKYLSKAEPVGETSIEYIYKGVDKGLDPAGGTLDTDNIISASVLNEAVVRANLTDTVTDISKLREEMRIEAVLPQEYVSLQQAAADGDQDAINTLRTYELHPTRYTIVISNPSNLGLSDAKTVELLDKIVAAYTDDFQKRFSVISMFDASLYNLSSSATIEYFDMYDVYVSSLTPMVEYLTQLQTEAPTFVSTGKGGNTTFTTLMSDISRLQSDYGRLNTFLLSNNVWKDKNAASTSLENAKADLRSKLENLEQYRITPLKDQIAAIKPNSITTTDPATGSTVVSESYPEEYYKYQAELNELNRQAYNYYNQLADIELRLAKLDAAHPAGEDLLARADAMVKALEDASEELVTKVNATITDYYDTTFVSSSVRQVAPSVVTRRTISFSILIVFVVAAVVGLLIGCIINGIVMYKAGKKQKAPAAVSDKAENKTAE